MMANGYHSSIKRAIFGNSMTDNDITSFLVKIGWGYTLFFVITALLRKLLGCQSVAPYGKFVDTSYLTGKVY